MSGRLYNGIPIEEILKDYEYDAAGSSAAPRLVIVPPDPDWPAHFEVYKSRILAAFDTSPSALLETSLPGPSPSSAPTVGLSASHQDGESEHGPSPAHSSHRTESFSGAKPDHASIAEPSWVPDVKIISITHIGSTSVPDLPSKPIIDIDLVISPSPAHPHEDLYVPLLRNAGFVFVCREPSWSEHRLFSCPGNGGAGTTTSPVTTDDDVTAGANPGGSPETVTRLPACNLHVWPPGGPEPTRHLVLRGWLRAHRPERELYARAKRESAAAANEAGESVMLYNLRKEAVVRGMLRRAFVACGLLVPDPVSSIEQL